MIEEKIGPEGHVDAALKVAGDRLRKQLNRFPALIRHFARNGVCWHCNLTWREFTGCISDSDGINDWMAAVHPLDRRVQLDAVQDSIATRMPFELEYRLRHRDGGYRRICEIGLPAFDSSGALLSYIGFGMEAGGWERDDGQLRRSQVQLRALNARLQRTREEERTRISREIHDVLGQDLTALRFDASAIRQLLHPSQVRLAMRLEAMEAAIDASIESLQRFVCELRPRILDDFGLQAAIEWIMSDFSARVGVIYGLSFSGDLRRLSLTEETTIFRIVQEASTNVARHARASRIHVGIEVDDARLRLEILDDGIGIPAECLHNPRSLGLLGMRERAKEIGGWLSIERRPTGGTRVQLDAPLERRTDSRFGAGLRGFSGNCGILAEPA